jgi:hypothetical protein
MRLLHYILIPACLFAGISAFSQNIGYARKAIDTLASPFMEGRGYVNHGDRKAADYIAGQFAEDGLSAFNNGYFQPYTFPMNTFPGEVNVTVNGKKLVAARDFLVNASSPAIHGEYKVFRISKDNVKSEKDLGRLIRKFPDKIVLIDKEGIENKRVLSFLDSLKYVNNTGAAGLAYVTGSKLTWSVMAGKSVKSFPILEISRQSLPAKPKKIRVNIENEFFSNYPTQNVLGYIKGSVLPDTFLVFTAHYDHLGRMGSEARFPGANDNASGTAMLLDMARHYSRPENKPYYSIAFFSFSGEEAGLHGATYCADHPPFPLSQIKFLVNMDMVGTGREGITMVNATVFKDAYNRMVKINADNEYILTVKERGESCNSDHCPFYKKGVPAVFIYSMGKEFGEYHNPDDISAKLPLTEYEDIFRLIVAFMNGFQPR